MVKAIEKLSALKARDVMTSDVLTLAPNTPLQDAVRTLAEAHISGAPVVDAYERLVGVLSARDVARPENMRDGILMSDNDEYPMGAADEDGDNEEDEDVILSMNDYSPGTLRTGVVTDHMSHGAVTVAPDAPIKLVCERMLSEHIHRVLVVDKNKLVGIVSSLDIVRAVAKNA